MANLGSFGASLISAKNENTAALVNVNLDISLYRCDPPKEFLPIGSALAPWRKQEAEDGELHKTACRLGFLFHELVPETPSLMRCYGTRASEIMESPQINPQGTTSDGPFCDFVGADGTCIWAVATSIPASFSTFLLACMLVRAWDAREAISIWAELVHERVSQVEAQISMNKVVNPHTVMAVRQAISRDDLAKWDARARAWLRRADQSMMRFHDQFGLIMKNVMTPFIDPGSTYDKVTQAWVRSLNVMEGLIKNVPQQVPDRAVLIAISAWHLYPDLLVCQEKITKVTMSDPLLPPTSVLTLGLEPRNPKHGSLCQWSLALSHLKYYGDPIKVRSEEDFQRVPFQSLWLVALGAILRQWELPSSSLGAAIAWFGSLGEILRTTPSSEAPELSWLMNLCRAASTIGEPLKSENEKRMLLVQFGWRRALNFLGSSGGIVQPHLFGLCKLDVIRSKQDDEDLEFGFRFVRQLASELGLEADEAIAVYTRDADGETYVEWATIRPVHIPNREISEATKEKEKDSSHLRWMYCVRNSDQKLLNSPLLDKIRKKRENLGEIPKVVLGENRGRALVFKGEEDSMKCTWGDPPLMFGEPDTPAQFWALGRGYLILGLQNFRLYIKEEVLQKRSIQAKVSHGLTLSTNWLNEKPDAEALVNWFKDIQGSLQRERSENVRKRRKVTDEPFGASHKTHQPPTEPKDRSLQYYKYGALYASPEFLISLRALELASTIYHHLPAATVSLKVIEQQLWKSHWLPKRLKMFTNPGQWEFDLACQMSVEQESKTLPRHHVFAAIAMFDSGLLNIEVEHLDNVVALCSEDSIFVSDILLSDPGTELSGTKMRHMVGNIGQAGMVFMVAPMNPRIRPPNYNPMAVRQRAYDGRCTDRFAGTSLHLSFTNWKVALDWDNTGEIDQQVFLVESVISVQDKGKWVADIDVLEWEKSETQIVEFQCHCQRDEPPPSEEDILSLETWDEILDPPASVGVIRANGNWAARLAAVTILAQKGQSHAAAVLGNDPICWRCLESLFSEPESRLPSFIVH